MSQQALSNSYSATTLHEWVRLLLEAQRLLGNASRPLQALASLRIHARWATRETPEHAPPSGNSLMTGLRAGVLQELVLLPAIIQNLLKVKTYFGAPHLCWRNPGLAQEVAHNGCEHGVGLGLGLLQAGLAAAPQCVSDPRRHAGAIAQAGARDQLLLEHHALFREDLRSAEGPSEGALLHASAAVRDATRSRLRSQLCLGVSVPLWQRAEAMSGVLSHGVRSASAPDLVSALLRMFTWQGTS